MALVEGPRRWADIGGGLTMRAVKVAKQRGDNYCGVEHLLLALAAPKQPTAASALLNELAAEGLAALRSRPAVGEPTASYHLNPAAARCVDVAAGLALAAGAERITDAYALLGVAYADPTKLVAIGADPDEVCEELARSGITTPAARPPVARTMSGPYNALLCIPRDNLNRVIKALSKHHPPGTEHWGINYFSNEPDSDAYVISVDSIDIEAIAREALGESGWYRRPFGDTFQG